MMKILQFSFIGLGLMLSLGCSALSDLQYSVFGNVSGRSSNPVPNVWELRETFPSAFKITAVSNSVFVMISNAVYRNSYDFSSGWTNIFTVYQFYDMDSESGNIYVSGLAVPIGQYASIAYLSSDYGSSFSQIWGGQWYWDPVNSIDYQKDAGGNIVGWITVDNAGSYSGVWRVTNGGAWEYKDPGSVRPTAVIADAVDPLNYAFVYRNYAGQTYYRTTNGGTSWQTISYRVIFSAEENNASLWYTASKYTADYGDTWVDLGITATAFVKYNKSADGVLFAARSDFNQGVLAKRESQGYNQWTLTGLANINVISMAIGQTDTGDYLFALANNGDIYRLSLSQY